MGMNIISGCHKCKVMFFHFRNEEKETVMGFYYKHRKCMMENPRNVETKEDQLQEERWMRTYRGDSFDHAPNNDTP